MKPSSLYQAPFWKLGLAATRLFPRPLLATVASGLCSAYCRANKSRREMVVGNLLPLFNGDRKAALLAARGLFQNFGVKLADLWRFEAGIEMLPQIKGASDWQPFDALRKTNRGILLLTPHLGNWELGAPLLASKGVNLHVITQPEPGSQFTELRQKARERLGIQTIVVGNDPFAFLEVIRKLDEGAVIALLVDRPPEPSAVPAKLFGRPFSASIAPAELARATGCALVPVVLPKVGNFYEAQLLPEIPYNRAELGNRAARSLLAQRIITAFEPAIRQYADQWYHFVPIWPEASIK